MRIFPRFPPAASFLLWRWQIGSLVFKLYAATCIFPALRSGSQYFTLHYDWLIDCLRLLKSAKVHVITSVYAFDSQLKTALKIASVIRDGRALSEIERRDPRTWRKQFKQLSLADTWKNSAVGSNGIRTPDLFMPVQCSTNWAMRANQLGAFVVLMYSRDMKISIMNLYEVRLIADPSSVRIPSKSPEFFGCL